MARVHIVLSRVGLNSRALTGSTMPVLDSAPIGSDTKTSSGGSTLSDISAGDTNAFWAVTADGGPVFLKFGVGTPVAASDDGWLLLSGQTLYFGVSTAGEKLAFKDA